MRASGAPGRRPARADGPSARRTAAGRDGAGAANPRGGWTGRRRAPGWQIYGLFEAPTGMKVKRAAPGGEGLVVDQLSPVALPRYLAGFDRAFQAGGPPGVRAFSSDSFEDMGSDFTAGLPGGVRRPAGLRPAPAPAGAGAGRRVDPEVAARVLADYRETVSDLLLERFAAPLGGLEPRPGFAGAQPGPRRAGATCWTSTPRPTSPRPRPSGPATSPSPGCTPTPTCPPTSASRTRCSRSWPRRRRTWPGGRWSRPRPPPGWASTSRWPRRRSSPSWTGCSWRASTTSSCTG